MFDTTGDVAHDTEVGIASLWPLHSAFAVCARVDVRRNIRAWPEKGFAATAYDTVARFGSTLSAIQS